MFLFLVLLITLVMLILITAFVISIFGAGFIIIFGDVIVCVLIIAWIIKKVISKKKDKNK